VALRFPLTSKTIVHTKVVMESRCRAMSAPTGVRMKKISPNKFEPELVSMMRSVLEAASAHIDTTSGKPATSAIKVKMASRILATAAQGVTDASQLQSAAIEEGLCRAD